MNRPLVLVAVALLFTACEKAEIETYRVAKTKVPQVAAAPAAPAAPATPAEPAPARPPMAAPANAQASMANTAVPTAGGANLSWSAPEHWKSKAASAMRKGTYTIPGEGAEAELSITAFPGDVGGELANVNRWRSQIGLDPIAAADLPKTIARIEANGLKIGIVDAGSPGGQRTLGAMVPFNGATWFFKMTGPDALVTKEKPAFLTFAGSIQAAK